MLHVADAAVSKAPKLRILGHHVDATPRLPHGLVQVGNDGAIVKVRDVELGGRADAVPIVV